MESHILDIVNGHQRFVTQNSTVEFRSTRQNCRCASVSVMAKKNAPLHSDLNIWETSERESPISAESNRNFAE